MERHGFSRRTLAILAALSAAAGAAAVLVGAAHDSGEAQLEPPERHAVVKPSSPAASGESVGLESAPDGSPATATTGADNDRPARGAPSNKPRRVGAASQPAPPLKAPEPRTKSTAASPGDEPF